LRSGAAEPTPGLQETPMKLSKQTSDAVNILLCCKRADTNLVKVGVIATELNLTKQMALKLANRLSRADLLDTVRGPKGGVMLTEQAIDLPLGQIVRRLEAVLRTSEDNGTSQPFDVYFDAAFEAFLDVLDQHTLSDLAAQRADATTKAAQPRNRTATGKDKPGIAGVKLRSSKARSSATRPSAS